MKVIKKYVFLFIFLGSILALSPVGAQNNDGLMVNSDGSEKIVALKEVTVVAKKIETSTTNMASWNTSTSCQWIKLNTNVPFVWKCIETKTGSGTTQLNAFPRLMGGMMRLLMTIILVMSLLMIVVGGVLMTTGGWEKNNYSKGMDMIKKVAYGLALLGASGVILKLINPNFFV